MYGTGWLRKPPGQGSDAMHDDHYHGDAAPGLAPVAATSAAPTGLRHLQKGECSGSVNPDEWGQGLRFGGKTLSTKSVKRAITIDDVIPVCLAHNLRQDNEDHRHRSRIDPSRTVLNEVLRGSGCAAVAAELARNVIEELGIRPARIDTIMGIEMVVQPPVGADTPEFWAECMAWADSRY